jgi:hypothetical protein
MHNQDHEETLDKLSMRNILLKPGQGRNPDLLNLFSDSTAKCSPWPQTGFYTGGKNAVSALLDQLTIESVGIVDLDNSTVLMLNLQRIMAIL